MIISGKQELPFDRARVWDYLNDPDVLRICTPGCESFRPMETDTYEAAIRVGIGPVSGVYQGKMAIVDKNPPESYSIVASGQSALGSPDLRCDIRLGENQNDTVVVYQADVTVSGMLAGLGQRVLGGVAKILVSQFFGNLKKEIQRREGSGAA